MDKNKFIEKLNQVAEWVYPNISDKSGQERLGLHRRPTSTEEWQTIEGMGPRITAFKENTTKCQYCELTNSHIGYQKVNHPEPGWYVYCYTCKHNIHLKSGKKYKGGTYYKHLKTNKSK